MGRPKGSKNKPKGLPRPVKAPRSDAKEKDDKYLATLKVFGKQHNALGDTIRAAIANITPGLARGVSVLSVQHGDKHQDRILPRLITWRLFNPSPTVREMALKTVSQRFDL